MYSDSTLLKLLPYLPGVNWLPCLYNASGFMLATKTLHNDNLVIQDFVNELISVLPLGVSFPELYNLCDIFLSDKN